MCDDFLRADPKRSRPEIEFDQYRVVVGEVGIVFANESMLEAQRYFNYLLSQTKTTGFAWPGKSIALFKGYQIIREYHPLDSEGDH